MTGMRTVVQFYVSYMCCTYMLMYMVYIYAYILHICSKNIRVLMIDRAVKY